MDANWNVQMNMNRMTETHAMRGSDVGSGVAAAAAADGSAQVSAASASAAEASRKPGVGKTILGVFMAFVIMIGSSILASLPASGLVAAGVPAALCNAVYGLAYLGIAVLLVRLVFGKALRLKVSELGMPKFSIRGRYVLLGILLPAVITGIFLLFVSGAFVRPETGIAESTANLSYGIFYCSIAAAFVEEIIFRGVIMHLLKKRCPTALAVLLPSLLFGLIHLTEVESLNLSDAALLVVAGTLAGTMFSVVALKSGSVWNSGIVHAIWNLIMVGGGLSIAPAVNEMSLVTYVTKNTSTLLTGGAFGVEASIIAIAGYLAVILLLCGCGKIKGKKNLG